METFAASLRHVTAQWALLLALCLFVSGCDPDHAVIWKAETKSPKGNWLAVAQTTQYGGPGNAGLYTDVGIKRPGPEGEPTTIFAANVGLAKNPHIDVRWLTDTHLEITYYGDAKREVQAIYCFGIDISARHLPD